MKYPHSIPKAVAPSIPTVYSRGFILKNYGCYSKKQALDLPYDQEGNIHIEVLKEHIPIKDFCWFLINRVFGSTQRAWFALDCAKFVLPVFEKACPNDERVAKCIEATEKLITEGSSASAYAAAAAAAVVAGPAAAADDADFAAAAAAAARADFAAARAARAAYYGARAAYDARAAYASYTDDAGYAAAAAARAAETFPSFVQDWINPYLHNA